MCATPRPRSRPRYSNTERPGPRRICVSLKLPCLEPNAVSLKPFNRPLIIGSESGGGQSGGLAPIQAFQVTEQLLAQPRPLQGERDRGLQEAADGADVVVGTLEFEPQDLFVLGQGSDSVGQLDLAANALVGGFQDAEDRGLEDV